jgi:hypothetical protein
MSYTVQPPTDNPPRDCTDVEFAVWAAAFRQRKAAELIAKKIPAQQIRLQVDLEVEAARRRSRPVESEVAL